jgi:hypothetical protein
MKTRLALCLVLVASAASAQDGAKPPAAPPTGPAKKERKTDPAAEAAMKKYASLLHFPSDAYKTLEMNSHTDVAMMGGEVGCKFTLKEGGSVDLDIAVDEAALRQAGMNPSQMKAGAKKMVGGIFRPFFVPPDVMAKDYDLASKTAEGRTVVEMKRFADGAAWDTLTLTLNADGLVENQTGMANVDPNDMTAAMDAGVEIETAFEYKKRGDKFTLEAVKISHPVTGESALKVAYYEIAGTQPLPKQIDINHPLLGELSIVVHDFVLDGKKVAGTERKEEPKPAPPTAPKPGEQPDTGPKQPPK